MHSPYTPEPLDAMVIAQTSTALVLTAIAWSRPSRPAVSSCVLVAATWWAALTPNQNQLREAFGLTPTQGYHWSLMSQAGLGTLAAVLTGRAATIVFAVIAQVVLAKVAGYVTGSDFELAGLNLAYFGALVGLQARARDDDIASTTEEDADESFFAHDLRVFALATLLAIAVSVCVLGMAIDSSDEWAYTFQAAVFAKGHAYAHAPPCAAAYRDFWVLESMGRLFSQYTPGWPLFMAAFSLFGVPYFAAAASLGLFVVGVARVARRAARYSGHAPGVVAAAGTLASLCAILSSTLLINGGSRYGHVFAAALLAWGIEAICAAEDASRYDAAGAQLGWSVALGSCLALLWATRPGDGTASATGLGLYGLYALARRRLSRRVVLGAVAGAAFFGGISLVLLRLQLGVWFKTGYSLTASVYPWAKVAFGWPAPNQWKYGVPLATGSYCWWPLSLPVGIAGLVTLRARATRIAFMLALGTAALFGLCAAVELGRGSDWGYGPRYLLSATVLMAVGTGVALAPLWVRARRTCASKMAGGPATMAALAVILGVLRLAPLVYPPNRSSVAELNAVNIAIKRERIHHAVVLLPGGVGWMNDGLDLTMNLPIALYPNQDVIIAMDKTPGLTECVRQHSADRTIYRAFPGTPVRFEKN